MTGKQTPSHGTIISDALQARALQRVEDAQARSAARNGAGQYLAKVSPEQWEEALDMIRDGYNDADVCAHLGITTGALSLKKRRDPAFGEAFRDAMEDAFVTFAREALLIADGVEGYSKGDVHRDRLSVQTRIELAKRFARRILGDHIQVDQRTIQINISKDDSEW